MPNTRTCRLVRFMTTPHFPINAVRSHHAPPHPPAASSLRIVAVACNPVRLNPLPNTDASAPTAEYEYGYSTVTGRTRMHWAPPTGTDTAAPTVVVGASVRPLAVRNCTTRASISATPYPGNTATRAPSRAALVSTWYRWN